MAYKPGILVGKITRKYGFEGSVAVKLEDNFTTDISELKSVFLEIEGKHVPFFITDRDLTGKGILRLRFEGYDRPEMVDEFTGCSVFLSSEPKRKKPGGTHKDLKDYKVILADNRILGRVIEIIKSPGQLLLNVRNTDGKEILIPLHDDLIVGLNTRKKIIKMDLPAGLITVNLR